MEALAYASSMAPDHLVAMTVAQDDADAERMEKAWAQRGITVPLEIVHSPNGEFTASTLLYVDELQHRWPTSFVNVVIPEFYVAHWWGHLLHNQSTLVLKGRLLFRRGIAVTSIPYRIEPSAQSAQDQSSARAASGKP
jgi:hypothetical protein